MANKDMESRIRHAFEAVTPDVLDNVLRNCHEQKGTVIPMTNKKSKKWIPLAAAAAMLVLVMGLGLGFGIYQDNYKVVSTVSIDVNPSLEIQLNGKQVVLDVDALNQDGKIILGDKKLNGKPLREAVDTLLSSMIEKGYLNEDANSILVSVDSETDKKTAELKETVNKEVKESLKGKKFEGAVITQSVSKDDALKDKAEQNNISVGKAKLIERILAQDIRYTFEELAALSINELNLLTVSGSLNLDNVTSSGSASESKFIGKEEAKNAALTHAQLAETDVVRMKIELECKKGIMVYEVEFHTAEYEYEYDINAESGEVIFNEKEAHPQRDEDNKPVLSPDVKLITEEAAVSAALSHAGLAEAETVKCKLDKDHGEYYYEIEIVADGTEYDYLVDAITGKVIRHQKEHEEDKRPQTEPETAPKAVDEATVKETVLAHAGVTEVTEYACELERDHNKLIYEIEFVADGTEYEYIVDAVSGKIVRFDKEAEDHYVDHFRPQKPQQKPTQTNSTATRPTFPTGTNKPSIPVETTKPTHPQDVTMPTKPTYDDHMIPTKPEADSDEDDDMDDEDFDPNVKPAPEADQHTRPENNEQSDSHRPNCDDNTSKQPQDHSMYDEAPMHANDTAERIHPMNDRDEDD